MTENEGIITLLTHTMYCDTGSEGANNLSHYTHMATIWKARRLSITTEPELNRVKIL